jgi:hypothetical protein
MWTEAKGYWTNLPSLLEKLNQVAKDASIRLPHDFEWYFATQSEQANQTPPPMEHAIVGSMDLSDNVRAFLGQPNWFGINSRKGNWVWLSNGLILAEPPPPPAGPHLNEPLKPPLGKANPSEAFPFHLAIDF